MGFLVLDAVQTTQVQTYIFGEMEINRDLVPNYSGGSASQFYFKMEEMCRFPESPLSELAQVLLVALP